MKKEKRERSWSEFCFYFSLLQKYNSIPGFHYLGVLLLKITLAEHRRTNILEGGGGGMKKKSSAIICFPV
jgi:hypothetical protein